MHTRIGASLSVACLALLALCAWAAPASASKPPEYSLSIVEGETTQPEDSIVSTSGNVHPQVTVAISIVRNGIVVARSTGNEGGVWMSQVPQVGDVVTLEAPIGTTVGSVVYDGLPSLEATVCVGSADFSGQRSSNNTVEGGYFTEIAKATPYRTSFERAGSGQAQITTLAGSAFGGSFLAPLQAGQTVFARESLETPLAGGAVFTYSSENDRPVSACPTPPAPPPTPLAPPALEGSLLKLLHRTILSLLKSGWHDRVTINQPGTVTQALYLAGGKLPAYAAGSAVTHHKKLPPSLLLARGSVTAKSAGTVSVLLKLTAKGRIRLRRAKNVKVVLISTLHSTSGAKLNLGRRTVLLHR
jgi:hypothetical protein